ncbi:putative transposase [Trichonephila clavipes]|nr:putative transposase [Trichonephila clavipes]
MNVTLGVCNASWAFVVSSKKSCSCKVVRDVRTAKKERRDISPSPATLNDEAHFWLNGYVNKQNCRIWSEANPQVCVEKPLHPEKLTVWCALWAGGILIQKR